MPTVTQSIREIVSTTPSAVAVLERFEIDISSQADTQLGRVCAELQLSTDQVLEKLADAESRAKGSIVPNFASYSLARLIQHIVRAHHQTVRQELPRIVELSQRIAREHGETFPELNIISTLSKQLHAEMLAHLKKEEQTLFPYIVRLEEGANDQPLTPPAGVSIIPQLIALTLQEFDSAQQTVSRLRQSTSGFTPPRSDCPLKPAFFSSLAAFEADLREHLHLESELLFPRTIALETGSHQRN